MEEHNLSQYLNKKGVSNVNKNVQVIDQKRKSTNTALATKQKSL